MRRNPCYQGPVSDHFDGQRFFNPDGAAPKGLRDVLRWNREGGRARWPDRVPLASRARPEPQVADLRVTMVGHATMLIQTAGLNLLTDPLWSDRTSPLRFAGPRRVVAPGVDFDALPRIDAILLSHNHYDHLDIATLRRLRQSHDPLVIAPLGNDAILARGRTGLRVVTADWGQTVELGALRVHFEPCHHWSARGMRDRSMALWAAFVIEGPAGRVLHIGDTGFDDGRPYRDLPARHGDLRLAILPIGAYEPRWFMRDQHQDPDEAVQGFRLSGARWAIGHHWGTVQLTNEAREAPLHALADALTRHDIQPERFRPLAPGEVWDIPI